MTNFIEVYPQAFDKSWCQEVIKIFDIADDRGLTLNRQTHDNVSKLNREDAILFESILPVSSLTADIFNKFNEIFWGTCYKQYSDKYAVLNTLGKHGNFSVKVQKTLPGQGYHVWHCEQSSLDLSSRLAAWTIYLNDTFEAGETEFLYQQYRYKPQEGDCIIFPASYTHTHRGNPPINGTKYIMTGWVQFIG